MSLLFSATFALSLLSLLFSAAFVLSLLFAATYALSLFSSVLLSPFSFIIVDRGSPSLVAGRPSWPVTCHFSSLVSRASQLSSLVNRVATMDEKLDLFCRSPASVLSNGLC
ncbi:hypothetical protein BVRB_9g208870 [Beta vulgaris subsp. vulgaris]|uniref:Uncharacterized protein n=1 Tax=Beta vulgaris subsp. vulgaris TaxID=3555 RepID=A0A0J8BPR5_BETVV|nr:hypothetical protein BVRB_9g208870 [Beta vulgaris subsp. vulgaris]